MVSRLPLSSWPQIASDGKCRAITVMRTNGKHIPPSMLNRLREAMGQRPLTDEELSSYGVPYWEEEL